MWPVFDNRIEYVTRVLIGSLKNSDFGLSKVIEDDLRSVTVRSYNRLRSDFNQIGCADWSEYLLGSHAIL